MIKEFFDANYNLIVFTFFIITALLFSFLMNSLFLRFFHTLGIRNRNDGTVIRWGTMSKPAVGGLSFYIMFLLSCACYSIFFSPNDALYNPRFMGFIMAMALGFLIGLADDAYDTRPVLKFAAQLGCGFFLILTGTYINISDNLIFNYVLTLFWVVGIMNSINMLDNMDGITSSVSCGIILTAVVTMISNSDYNGLYLMICFGVLAALLGFLYYNWHPSKMFMGDTGSQFLGVFLAAIGIMFFWNNHYAKDAVINQQKQFITALIAFILPIVDTSIVVFNRLSKGKSPFIGGKDHTTHSLAYMGLNDKQVGFVYVILSVVSTILVFIINQLITEWSVVYTYIFSGYFALLGTFFFITTRKNMLEQAKQRAAKNVLETTHS